MVAASTHGAQKGRLVAAMRRLPLYEPGHSSGPVSAALPLRLRQQAARVLVRQQLTAGNWQLPSFFLQKLTAAQQRYSTFDHGLTAVFTALRHFHIMVLDRQHL
jgi:RNase H-like domain found in reverse transcriptase